MSITDYHIFQTIVETGSFATASDKLGMTSSALSRRLSRLEDRLGHHLMIRTTRRLDLTEKGEIFLDHCHRLVAAMDAAEAEISKPETELAGLLRIQIIAAYASRGFLPFLKAFQTRYPRIIVKLIPDNASSSHEEPDIIIASTRTSSRQGGVILEDNPWIICAAPSYLDQHGTPRRPEDLTEHHCLCLDRGSKSDQKWPFDLEGKRVVISCQPSLIGSGNAIHAAARDGMGIARLASYLVRQDLMDGRLVPLLQPFAIESERAICAFAAEDKIQPRKVKAFLDCLIKTKAASRNVQN